MSRKSSPMLTPNVVKRFAQSFDYIKTNAHKFTYPFMVLIGGKDPVVCNDRTREIYGLAGSKDKVFVEIEDGYHQLHKDICSDRVLESLFRYLNGRVNG